MSKQDQAAKAIKFAAARGYTPEQIATLLNELNLLATDAPQPYFEHGHGPNWEIPLSDGLSSVTVRVLYGEVNVSERGLGFHTNSAEARKIAAAILAAADYTEEV